VFAGRKRLGQAGDRLGGEVVVILVVGVGVGHNKGSERPGVA